MRCSKRLVLLSAAKRIIARYSGGMAQRLLIARALMHSPEILFLDEPTNNLDPQSRLFLWDCIRALHEQGITILLITHNMDEAERLCTRIAIMDHGRILALGTAAELKTLIPGGTSLEIRAFLPEAVPLLADAPEEASAAITSPLLKQLRALPGVTKVDVVAPVDEEEAQLGLGTIYLYAEKIDVLLAEVTQMTSCHKRTLSPIVVEHCPKFVPCNRI